MKRIKIGLLLKVLIAIVLGSLIGIISPLWLTRAAVTVTGIFGNFLDFVIPIIILGLVAPGIAEIGRGAGRLILITVSLAYGFTVFSGLFTYGVCGSVFPTILSGKNFAVDFAQAESIPAFFSIEMPPLFGVMSALVLAFILGVSLSVIEGNILKQGLSELRDVINKVISSVIIPFIPIYIGCLFLNISASGQIKGILSVFIVIIAVIFALHIILLLLQFTIAAGVRGGNPLKYLKTMLPAYATALGTQSSAATIPVTLAQTEKNGVDKQIAGFVIPLCATIHLSGSTMKITACAIAIMILNGMPIQFETMLGFILMLGIAMIAAPGVPSGAIMAALGVLSSILGFDETMLGLMIALYIAMDSFGTACNVTGDGAIALIVDKIYKNRKQ